MRILPRSTPLRRGLSLLEVLIAGVVFSLGALSLFQLSQTTKATVQATRVDLLADQLEEDLFLCLSHLHPLAIPPLSIPKSAPGVEPSSLGLRVLPLEVADAETDFQRSWIEQVQAFQPQRRIYQDQNGAGQVVLVANLELRSGARVLRRSFRILPRVP